MPNLPVPRIILVIIIWLAGLGAGAQFGKVSITFQQVQEHYDSFGTMSGLLVSLLSFLGVVLGLVAGLLGARIGYRKLLLGGLWTGAVVSLLQTFMPPFNLMLAARLIEGISHLAIVVAAPTLISAIAKPSQLGFAMTLWGTFFGVAFAAIAFVGPTLMAMGGLSTVFAAHGLYMATFATILTLILPTIKELAPGKAVPFGLPQYLRLHWTTYRSPFIAAASVGWLPYTLSFVAMISVMPRFLADEHEKIVMTLIPLASIVTSLVLGVFLLRFIRPISVVVLGFGAGIAFLLAFLALPESPYIPVLLYAALGLVQGASFTAVPDLNPEIDDRAKAYGAMAQMGNLGNLLGTPIILFVLGVAGFTGMILTVSLLYLAAIIAHLWLSALRMQSSMVD